jgi:cytochrome c553
MLIRRPAISIPVAFSWCVLFAAAAAAPLSRAQSAFAQEETRAEALATQAILRKPSPESGRALYRKECARCHGRAAQGDGAKAIPALAGQHFSYLAKQLADFIELERDVPEMHRLFAEPRLGTPQVIANLSEYLSQLPPNEKPMHGDARSLGVGGGIYDTYCSECHGSSGEGSDADMIPVLRGQHYSYLLLQMRSLVSGHRANTFGEMAEFLDSPDTEQMKAVADFITRLEPPQPEE